MALKNTDVQYGSLAKLLHWVIAAGILTLLFLGLAQADMERGDAKSYLRFIHSSVATVVLLLMSARLIWRLINPTPAHPEGMPGWQKLVASATHWGLYLCVFIQLGAGAMVMASAGRGLPMFGFFSIPLPVEQNRDQHDWWEEIHEFMWKPLAVLIVLHVLGALYNHFALKNDVLKRMTIGVK